MSNRRVDEESPGLREALDRLQIIDLEGQYAAAFDSRDGQTWASLFVADGIYQSRQRSEESGRPRLVLRGREELARFCESYPMYGLHQMNLPHIVLEDDTAASRIHFRSIATSLERTAPSDVAEFEGYYDVDYSRTAEGWKIVRRMSTATFLTRTSRLGAPETGRFVDWHD